jgi:hypothetical protein
VQRIINATPNEVIKVSAASMLFGNAIDLDRGIFTPLEVEGDIPIALSEWAAEMIRMQNELFIDARRAQMMHDSKNISKRTPTTPTEFKIDSFVLIGYPITTHHRGPPTKFHANLKGPMQVVERSGARYTLRNLVNNRLEDYHVTTLRQFKYDPQYVDPYKIALRDEQFYEIEKIIDHRGEFNDKSNLHFKVKWLGYDDNDNTWEPWKNVRANLALHKYLRDKKLQRHIPKEYK